ncbi:hypothetical protein RF11_04873 [Thelohanellus kitauei]|uniref:Uncharacterized protein n=1 Tax=Thelohanellus kitauei TaxID=669202 RepID=A0A0C2J1G4_THEKT|nr:hypothetical protein RF11_04873 [Thelohanellus kitauei]
MLKPSKRSNILSIIHNPNNDQFGPSPPPFIWMSDVLISITFNLGNVGITRKVYEVSPLMHMRMFKSIVANDLSANYAINLKPLHNYGFIRPYDSRFLADHEQVGTLTFGSELPNNAIVL